MWARGARAGAHLGLLLGEACLRRDQAQRGGVRVLVDLVEVVLQDLHLVLSGAARGLGRHGPGAAAGEGEAAVMSEAVGRVQGGTAIRVQRVSSAAGCAGSLRGALPGARPGGPPVDLRVLGPPPSPLFLQQVSPGLLLWDNGRRRRPRPPRLEALRKEWRKSGGDF